ncbi:hypothetical protein ACFSCW_09475 [Sphingomonas tabacisoli]|uniref:Autotransporter domain-containing protein n=1 Tax=Sphingomonas tabacisoli TaxID=2249466 RepID=A0ABW4I274_9SPHN
MACPAGPALAGGPDLAVSITSNEQVGLKVSGDDPSASASAAFGLWGDRGAVELGGFQDRATGDAAEAAEIVSGKPMRTRGVRLNATMHRRERGWSLGIEARQQRVTDVGAALSGGWHRSNESRLTLGGKLKF